MNRCLTKALPAPRLRAIGQPGVRARCLLGGLVLAAASPAFGAAARIQDNTAGGAPAAPERAALGPGCSNQAAQPVALRLQIGKSQMVSLPEKPLPLRVHVGNPSVAQAMMVATDTMYVAAVDVGTTNLVVQGKSGLCTVYDITVALDPAALQATLAAVMPEEKDIRVLAAADSLVLTGTVSDAAAMARAGELAAVYVRRPVHGPTTPDKDDKPTSTGQGSANANQRVINLLAVSAAQQVQLEVKIAEVSKTLLERLEAGATFRFGSGSWGATLLSNFITGTAHGLFDARRTNGKQQLTVEAEKQDGLVRVLAEPNVMAISGQEGSFLAGGKFYVPVAQENNRVTLEEKEFGVGLRFTPTVLSGGRINLKVAPEVSELSREGIGVSANGLTGTAILPLITTRRASTTVQLYDGQSFAIGGLIKNNLVTNLKGLPVLGEVPILGALFRSTDYQQDRTELVFVITAHLVKPLPGSNYALPTDYVGEPSPGAVLIGGRIDGAAPAVTTAQASTPRLAAPSTASAGGFELK
jgi:pilus assembly protein CpaC